MPSKSSLIPSITDENHDPILFIFLGASNLARSFYGLKLCITRCLFPRSVSFIHAMGPGRGYISQGGIFNVIYTPILHSGVLEAVSNTKNQKVVALITDIGNDIMYGIPAEKIIGGLKSIFDGLNKLEANIFITTIPVDLKKDISEFYFHILRKFFFPRSTVEYNRAWEAIQSINAFILQPLNKNIIVIDEMNEFCGVDKIHFSLLKSCSAWSHIAGNLTSSFAVNAPPKLRVSELTLSFVNNIARILLTDMLGMVNKTNESF